MRAPVSRERWTGSSAALLSFSATWTTYVWQPLTRGTHHSSLDLFQWLQQFGLVINLEKCTFHVKEIEFLGHSVSARGAIPLSSNVEAVQHFPEPATVKACKYSWAWSTFTVASFPMPPACCFPSQTAYVGDCHPSQRCTGHL